jgi:uncharacterized membrane protein YoaK (UPF0700 family)
MGAPAPAPRPAIAVLLAFTAGYVDTISFVGLFGLFTAHVTGNFVVMGATIAHPHPGLVGKLLALPTFIFSVALTTLFARRRRRAGRDPTPAVLIAQALLLAAFMAVALASGPLIGGDEPAAILAGQLGVLAMGIQNASTRLLFTGLSPTTVMTSNVTQIVIDSVDLLESRDADPTVRSGALRLFWPIAAFAAGALGGGLAFAAVGFWGLIAPIAATLAVIPLRSKTHVAD